MAKKFNTLILGASYGSLLGTKLALAGHSATLVCTAPTARLINEEGTIVRFPVRGLDEPVIVHSPGLSGKINAQTPEQVTVEDYDLVVLGMQEPQYGNASVRALMEKIAAARLPCMAIMNMPPLPYIQRLPGIDSNAVLECYADPSVWDNFDPELMTLASPDPQAFRPPDAGKNVLQVSLPTNFKVARFGLRTAGQVEHADDRQLPMRAARCNDPHTRCSPRQPRQFTRDLSMDGHGLPGAGSRSRRPGTIREIR